MKCKWKGVYFSLLMVLFCLVGSTAEAKMAFNLNNNSNRKIFVALAYEVGSSMQVRGWYGVDANSKRTVNFEQSWKGRQQYAADANSQKPMNLSGPVYPGNFVGFYAENSPAKGKSKLVWKSDGSDEMSRLPIHPKKPFKNVVAFGGGDDTICDGAVTVNFRKIKFKSDDDGNATATINFK